MRLLIRSLCSSLHLILFLAGGLSGQSLVSLEYWEFNDVAGKSFDTGANDGMTNSGDNGTHWNLGGTVSNSMETDGNGNFVISNHNGQTYRKLPDPGYTTPYSSGKYRLEMNFTSWNLDNSSNGAMGMELVDASNARVLSFTLGVDTNDTSKGKFQFAGISEGSTRQDKLIYGNQTVDLSHSTRYGIAIEFDFDNDTLEFFADGNSIRTVTDFNATEFSQLKFFTNNPWTANSTVSLDSMGLLQIPEPETYALTLGLLLLLALSARRLSRVG